MKSHDVGISIRSCCLIGAGCEPGVKGSYLLSRTIYCRGRVQPRLLLELSARGVVTLNPGVSWIFIDGIGGARIASVGFRNPRQTWQFTTKRAAARRPRCLRSVLTAGRVRFARSRCRGIGSWSISPARTANAFGRLSASRRARAGKREYSFENGCLRLPSRPIPGSRRRNA